MIILYLAGLIWTMGLRTKSKGEREWGGGAGHCPLRFYLMNDVGTDKISDLDHILYIFPHASPQGQQMEVHLMPNRR